MYEYGKGRVVKLDFGLLPADGDETRYEYYQSFLIKAVLWATGREPAVLFKGFPASLTVQKGEGGVATLEFHLVNAGRPATYRMDLGVCAHEGLLDVPGCHGLGRAGTRLPGSCFQCARQAGGSAWRATRRFRPSCLRSPCRRILRQHQALQ